MLSNKDGEVFGLRCSTRWLCRMKKGGPKAAPLPSRFTAGHAPRRHRGELSWIGAHAAQADRRSYHATVVSQWSRALTSSTTVQIRANKKGDRSRPLACAIVE